MRLFPLRFSHRRGFHNSPVHISDYEFRAHSARRVHLLQEIFPGIRAVSLLSITVCNHIARDNSHPEPAYVKYRRAIATGADVAHSAALYLLNGFSEHLLRAVSVCRGNHRVYPRRSSRRDKRGRCVHIRSSVGVASLFKREWLPVAAADLKHRSGKISLLKEFTHPPECVKEIHAMFRSRFLHSRGAHHIPREHQHSPVFPAENIALYLHPRGELLALPRPYRYFSRSCGFCGHLSGGVHRSNVGVVRTEHRKGLFAAAFPFQLSALARFQANDVLRAEFLRNRNERHSPRQFARNFPAVHHRECAYFHKVYLSVREAEYSLFAGS
ncbi:unknown [Eubacterium sp. CAG:786]|nr:unknown [Eubacterium sp. CAG:786]